MIFNKNYFASISVALAMSMAVFLAPITSNATECPPQKQEQFESLDKTIQSFLGLGKKLASTGVCSPELVDAAGVINDLVLSQGNEEYRKGDSGAIKSSNSGLVRHFRIHASKNPNFRTQQKQFIELVNEVDSKNKIPPEKLVENRPSLFNYQSPTNFYDLALKVTNGNVFEAMTLIASIGHDDIHFSSSGIGIDESSNLFAAGSLGPEVKVEDAVKTRMKLAVDNAAKYSPENKAGASKVGDFPAINYHMIAGMFIGCELAKKGFTQGTISEVAISLFSKIQFKGIGVEDPLIKNVLNRKPIQKGKGYFSADKISLDICTDLPSLAAVAYKKLKLSHAVHRANPDSKTLLDQGYSQAFQCANVQCPLIAKLNWGAERAMNAKADLDLILQDVEYGMEQHRAGAAFGANACREYQSKSNPSK